MFNQAPTPPKSLHGYRDKRIRRSAAKSKADQLRPVIRVERRLQLEGDSDNLELQDYTQEFAARNRQFPVKNLGSMACTYVSSGVLCRALSAKYESFGSDRQQTSYILRAISQNLKNFIKFDSHTLRQNEEFTLYAEQFGRRPEDTELQLPSNPLQDAWKPTSVRTRPHLVVFDNRNIALNLDDNPVLHYEQQAVQDFLRTEEGLDVELAARNYRSRPHLSIVRATPLALRTEEIISGQLPEQIMLERPSIDISLGIAAIRPQILYE